jgi:hypothetical protein
VNLQRDVRGGNAVDSTVSMTSSSMQANHEVGGDGTASSHSGARQNRAGTVHSTAPFVPVDIAVSALKNDTSLATWKLWAIQCPEDSEPLSAELRRGASSMEVDVDPSSARIVNVSEPSGYGVSMDANNLVEALHFGRVGGPLTQVLRVLLL